MTSSLCHLRLNSFNLSLERIKDLLSIKVEVFPSVVKNIGTTVGNCFFIVCGVSPF